jgi:hypothetical protein
MKNHPSMIEQLETVMEEASQMILSKYDTPFFKHWSKLEFLFNVSVSMTISALSNADISLENKKHILVETFNEAMRLLEVNSEAEN